MIANLSRRGSGGRGFISGAGETELQLQRRRCASYFWCPNFFFFLTVISLFIFYALYDFLFIFCT